jgi:predicted regulator of Ras-like GTPase activity (Roadblock/LC7/MglB family)
MSAIATAVKASFVGFLRKLLNRFDDNEAARQPASGFVATAATLVMPPPVMPPQAAPHPVKPETPPAQPTSPTFNPSSHPANPDELRLPLQPILDALPMELRARVKRTDTANMTVLFPLEKILTQLALGTVRVTFGELRQAAPGVFADVDGGHDQKPVALPLNEILIRLNPSLLARRMAQKHVEVNDDIASPFGEQGQGLELSPPSANPAAPIKGVPITRTIRPVPSAAARVQSPSTVLPPPFPARSITPATNGSATRNITPVITPTAAEPPGPPVTPIAPITTISPIAPTRVSTDAPTIKMPETPAPGQPPLSVPLSALLANWPTTLKLEIVQLNLSNAQVALPLDVVESGLKHGRVAFSWRNLRALIKPAPSAVSAHDAVELELPLHVIAPLFLARRNGPGAKSPQKTADFENIPNLFFGPPASTPAITPPAPIAPPPIPPVASTSLAPSPIPPVTPLTPALPTNNPPVAAPMAKLPNTNTNFFLRNGASQITDTEFQRRVSPATDFLSRGATPKEVVERATFLEGVAGAIVALPDGLNIASKVSADLNADTLAAFLPQLFSRVSQCSKELRMGELNNLNFTVGKVPWKIFRVSAVYFAAFGYAGQVLPTAELALLANELDRKRQ